MGESPFPIPETVVVREIVIREEASGVESILHDLIRRCIEAGHYDVIRDTEAEIWFDANAGMF